ncbi:MAG: acyltransferase [Bacteroidales bacterium]|nr:acyltransferase [Bacteroidales bacterium]MDD3663671.1 acyltransferase [Bacteroidales bacterium]
MNLRDRIARLIIRVTKPRMITGFKRSDGVVLKNLRLGSTTVITCRENFFPQEDVFIGHHNFIESSNTIQIGQGCQITNFVSLTTHSSHISIRLYGDQYAGADMAGYITGKIEIGDYTFIGPHATIMPGTKIGKGCIVAANSYVKGLFDDFSVIKGNPATVVGDTRTMDRPFLDTHPELNASYFRWAEDGNTNAHS